MTWTLQELDMKRVAVVSALVASLLAGTAAMAHDRGDFDHRDPPRVARYDDRYDSRYDDRRRTRYYDNGRYDRDSWRARSDWDHYND